MKKSFFKKYTKNPWVISTVVLAIVLILSVFGVFGSCTGKVVSEKKASQGLVSYFEANGVPGLEVQSVEKEGSTYLINVSYQGNVIPFYVTKDGYMIGNYLVSIFPDETPVQQTSSSTKVEPREVPFAKLFIWSYCPYGVTALGPFADVAKFLGNYADFKVFLYHAGHGEFEEQQNKIQACIQDLGYKSEYWEYAKVFSEEIYDKCYGDAACDFEESVSLMNSLGIDSGKVMSCVDSKGISLLEEHYAESQKYGVKGSPTLVVNDAQVSVSRTAEAFKGAVCSGFTNVPELCSTQLETTGTTASGSC